MKDSFVLYNSFYEPIQLLSCEDKSLLLDLIFEYNSSGVVSEISSVAVKIIWATIRQQFDRDKVKYQNVVQRNRLNGQKGGRPSKDNPNIPVGYLETQEETQEPKKADTVSDTVSDDVSVTDDVCKEKSQNQINFEKLNIRISKDCPNVAKLDQQLTFVDFEKLIGIYSKTQIWDILEQMNNKKDLTKKYTSVYRTTLNWLKNNGTKI